MKRVKIGSSLWWTCKRQGDTIYAPTFLGLLETLEAHITIYPKRGT